MLVNGMDVEEYAKLAYGRLLWRNPACRERLLRHCTLLILCYSWFAPK